MPETDSDPGQDRPKPGIIRRVAGGLVYSFIGRLPQQLSEQRSRLTDLVRGAFPRQRTSRHISQYTVPQLRQLIKVAKIDAAVMGVVLLLLFLGAYLKYPDMRSLLVIFGLVLFTMARLHRACVNLLIAKDELAQRDRLGHWVAGDGA